MAVFDVTATDGEARAGVLRTAHGEVRTPVFMPVGTKATVKTLMPAEVRALGAQILLGNSYHLHFRPGDALIAELGGLHRFMAWDGPILTDSGGFQVFSLRDTLLAVDDDGVTFRSVYDGAATRFTPELAAEVQRNLGSDVAMCLDQVPPAGISRRDLEELRDAGQTVDLRVLGLATIANDVSADLALATISSVEVLGAFRAPKTVKAALANRTTT